MIHKLQDFVQNLGTLDVVELAFVVWVTASLFLLPRIYIEKNEIADLHLGLRITVCWVVIIPVVMLISWGKTWALSI